MLTSLHTLSLTYVTLNRNANSAGYRISNIKYRWYRTCTATVTALNTLPSTTSSSTHSRQKQLQSHQAWSDLWNYQGPCRHHRHYHSSICLIKLSVKVKLHMAISYLIQSLQIPVLTFYMNHLP